jgi:hypothetical protein
MHGLNVGSVTDVRLSFAGASKMHTQLFRYLLCICGKRYLGVALSHSVVVVIEATSKASISMGLNETAS